MDVGVWAEIHRLKKIEGLSNRVIAQRLRCCHKTVRRALKMSTPTSCKNANESILDPFKPKINDLIDRYPKLSAVRVNQEIIKSGFKGEITIIRRYLRKIRPVCRGRVYLESHYEPGEAVQVDYGECGKIKVGDCLRKLYVFVAVLCYSRLIHIEFSLSQQKEDFYTSIVNTFRFIGGMPRKIIIDNLKVAVVEGSGSDAKFHPEFLALCGHYLIQPVACPRRDPESKGRVEDGVKYVKINALAGYDEKLISIDDYHRHAIFWRDEVANVRIHGTTRRRPIDMFEEEKVHLRPLPEQGFDTDAVLIVVASPMAYVRFDCNRYSVPPAFARRPLTLRANQREVKVFNGSDEIARHQRCYEKGKPIEIPEHRKLVLALRERTHLSQTEAEFDALGQVAKSFRAELKKRTVKSVVHMRRILKIATIYGNTEVLQALSKALEFNVIDAAYVENILLQQRRANNLPSPTPLCPIRKELLEEVFFEEPDPTEYDILFDL
jgi:transposase